MKKVILFNSFFGFLIMSNISIADSLSTDVVSGHSSGNRCYWQGKVTVDVAYELTSRGTNTVFLSVKDRSTGKTNIVGKKVVSRGAGVVPMSFNAGGCMRGDMRAYWGN